MTTLAELRARGGLSPEQAADVFELAARLQVADRAFDPARRPLGEGRALDEHLDVAPHFIDEARARISRRDVIALTAPLQPTIPSRWPLILLVLVVAGAVAFLSTLVVGRGRVRDSQRAAQQAERSLTQELLQQVDRASAVSTLAGPASGDVEPLRVIAAAAPDVPEQMVAVGALGREMQRVLQDLPRPATDQRARLHAELAQEVQNSRRRIDSASRMWREANADWNAACERGPGKLAVALDLAEAPPGPLRNVPRP